MDNKSEECLLYVKPLPAELLGRSIQKLSLIDRLKCERVSPRWKWIVGEFGWTEEKKLDHDILFEGNRDKVFQQTTGGNKHYLQRFYDSAEGKCNLISLIERIGPNLVKLDLASFYRNSLLEFVPKLAESLKMMKKLEKLKIEPFKLEEFVPFLPTTLRKLKFKTFGNLSIETLKALSMNCPNLECVPFHCFVGISLDNVGTFIGRFPRQKSLDLRDDRFSSGSNVNLDSIGTLRELEELRLLNFAGFDESSFEAMTTGCISLRKIHCYSGTHSLTEAMMFNLAKLPNLTVLELGVSTEAFTDSVLKEIAKRGKLKKLYTMHSDLLTDDSIEFLVDRCKDLVSLDLYFCKQITERSLNAVINEVHRRYGNPPRLRPMGYINENIFYFNCHGTGIDEERARKMTAGNPWLQIVDLINDIDDWRAII